MQLRLGLGWRSEALLRPIDAIGGSQPFSISIDESTVSILSRLQSDGLIRDANLFGDYLVYSGLDTQLQAGEFELSQSMNAIELANALLDPNPGQVTLSIFAGWRMEEIVASLASTGLEISPQDFWEATQYSYPEYTLLNQASTNSLEGYFLPGSYVFEREASAESIVRTLLEKMESQVGEELLQGFTTQGLNFHEALTLASIVERESVIEEEMPQIASVFLNRLAIDMKLEADPTVQYAIGFDEGDNRWWSNSITAADLAFDSPYNSYVYVGLPPGPIASPSLQALQAVAFPQSSPYYFFQAACDDSGFHVFAVSFEEHLGNNCP
jgi:UPF0755 protein